MVIYSKSQKELDGKINIGSTHEIDSIPDNKNVGLLSKPAYGFILAGLTGGIAILLSAITAPFIFPALRKVCLPYVPATNQQVINILKASKGKRGNFIDLGSGDGRIVISIAKNIPETKATGVELNPWLVYYSKLQAWRNGISNSTHFMRKNLWKINLSLYDNVIIFGVNEMMQDLQTKFLMELQDDANIIACRFPLPEWTPYATFGEGIDTVWLYKKPNCNLVR